METGKRVEKFIRDCTRTCSNELIAVESRAGKEVVSYHEWLTPDQSRRAVEIAREEIYEWLSENFFNYFEARCSMLDMFLEDLKQAMKDG